MSCHPVSGHAFWARFWMQLCVAMPMPAGLPQPAQVPPSRRVAPPGMSTFKRMAEMLELSIRVDMAAAATSLAATPQVDAKRDHETVVNPARRPGKQAVAPSSHGAASSNPRWQGTSRGQPYRRPSRSPPWHRKREHASRPGLLLTSGPQADRTQAHIPPTGESGQGQGVSSEPGKASGEEPSFQRAGESPRAAA